MDPTGRATRIQTGLFNQKNASSNDMMIMTPANYTTRYA
jgi:hypothetical protein